MGVFDQIVGQHRAVDILQASARSPVHAYMLLGPPGSGKRDAARAFAAALLCSQGGCGTCDDCRAALAENHVDLSVHRRTGQFISVEDARAIGRIGARRPVKGLRQVVVVEDVHLAAAAAPALLKSVEEPPARTVYVLLADWLPSQLAPLASRCVIVEFTPIPEDEMIDILVSRGVDGSLARDIAKVAGGRLDRAELLVDDPSFSLRYQLWRSIPDRLDGSGATIVGLARELLDACDQAIAVLKAHQAEEMTKALERAEQMGASISAAAKEIEDRHHREQRKWRNDELRFGLGVLAETYANSLRTMAHARSGRVLQVIEAIDQASRALVRNPNESLLLEALLAQLTLIS